MHLSKTSLEQLTHEALLGSISYQKVYEWLGSLVHDPDVIDFLDDLEAALEDDGRYYCGNCGLRCEVTTIDDRFDYEYGSIHGTAGDVGAGSYCCEAGLYADGLLTQEVDDVDLD